MQSNTKKDVIYLSSFDPITDCDIDFISHTGSYLPFSILSLEIDLFSFKSEQTTLKMREEMVRLVAPNISIHSLNQKVKSVNDLHLFFPNKHIVMPYFFFKKVFDMDSLNDSDITLLTSGMDRISASIHDGSAVSDSCIKQWEGESAEKKTQNGSELCSPIEVLEYIANNKLYFADTLFQMEGTHRYEHSVQVAKTAYQIAQNNGLDPILCYQMGLFHDAAKHISDEESLAIIQQEYPQFSSFPSYSYHQFIGAYFAKNRFHIPSSLIDPIQYHCTGRKHMTMMDQCLFVADKVEPTRRYETKELRDTANKNLREGFIAVLNSLVEHYNKCNINYLDNQLSIDMYTHYLGKEK